MNLFTDGLKKIDLSDSQRTALLGIEKAAREGDDAVHTGVKTILDSMESITNQIISEQQSGKFATAPVKSEVEEVERLLWVFLTLIRSSATLRVKTLDSIVSILSNAQAANFHIACADKSNSVSHPRYSACLQTITAQHVYCNTLYSPRSPTLTLWQISSPYHYDVNSNSSKFDPICSSAYSLNHGILPYHSALIPSPPAASVSSQTSLPGPTEM